MTFIIRNLKRSAVGLDYSSAAGPLVPNLSRTRLNEARGIFCRDSPKLAENALS